MSEPVTPEPPVVEPQPTPPPGEQDVPTPESAIGGVSEPGQSAAREERSDAEEDADYDYEYDADSETESAKPRRPASAREGIRITVDFVTGGANLDTVAQGPLISGTRSFTSVVDSSRVTATSFVLGTEYALSKPFALGVRLPIIMGELESRTGSVTNAQSDLFMAGNLEFQGRYSRPIAPQLMLEAGLALALPTAGGEEPPITSDAARDPRLTYNYASTDRFYLARAAELTRGSQESALFEPGRLGLVPNIGLRGRVKKLRWSAVVKVQNLIATTKNPESRYIGEVVAALRGSYELVRHVEPGLAVWTNITYTLHAEREQTGILLEPNVRFPFNHIVPYAGVVIPVAGRFVDQNVFAVRVGVAIDF